MERESGPVRGAGTVRATAAAVVPGAARQGAGGGERPHCEGHRRRRGARRRPQGSEGRYQMSTINC